MESTYGIVSVGGSDRFTIYGHSLGSGILCES